MNEVSVTRCKMEPEMGKFYRVFEYMDRLICLREELVHKSVFYTDINEMCWITDAGERVEMTTAEKNKIICEIKKWNKRAKRQGKMAVGFVDTKKGFHSLSDKTQNKLMLIKLLILFVFLCTFLIVWVMICNI